MAERYQWEPSNDAIARQHGLDPTDVVRFDQNTAPEPPSGAAPVAAMAALAVNEYPDASYERLRFAAAGFAGVDVEHVVTGAGLDELILLAAQAFLGPGDRSVMVSPTYSLHRLAVGRVGAAAVEIPLATPDFSVPTYDLLDAAGGSALTWLCVPNNPTGTRIDPEIVRSVVDATRGVTFLDAAYAEIAGDDWSGWLDDCPRLVIGHTLSKAFALAGARVGYALASPDLVAAFDDVRPPGSISSLSAALGIAALSDPGSMCERVTALRSERARLTGLLTELGLEPVPSEGNFVLAPVAGASRVAEGLRSEGIVVRSYDDGPLVGYLRFTVRSPDEDDRLVDALRRQL